MCLDLSCRSTHFKMRQYCFLVHMFGFDFSVSLGEGGWGVGGEGWGGGYFQALGQYTGLMV